MKKNVTFSVCNTGRKEMEYNSFVNFFKEKYGARLQKVVVDAGFTCPNRDGGVCGTEADIAVCGGLTGGCTFCDNAAFHPGYATPAHSIAWQIEEGIKFHKVRYRKAQRYIAYFQPHTNTYASLRKMKEVYEDALSHPLIEGIVVGTRPDCIDEEKLDYFAELSKNKIVILEYGVESIYDRTLQRINRGHTFEQSRRAIELTAAKGIVQCAHFIFGLPGESMEDMEQYAEVINTLPLTAVKFHQLQIIRGTKIEKEYQAHREDFYNFTLDAYLEFIAKVIGKLRPDIYIDRFAGEVPPRFLSPLQPSWGLIRYQELTQLLCKKLQAEMK